MASADPVNVSVPLLRLDVPLEDQLAEGLSRLFRFDAEPGQTVEFSLDSINNIGSHELYAAYERLPTPFDFDAAYEGYLASDQTLVIPETLGGRYFVLARAGVRIEREDFDYDPTLRDEYPVTLNATRIPFGITGVTPDSGGDDRYVTVTIFGAEFPDQAAVRLVRPTLAEFAPVSVRRVNATKIIAVFDLRNAPYGLYDVQVLHPDGRVAVDPYRFQIESADSLQANVGVGGPSQIDLGATGSYGFAIQNLSNVDTPYTLFEYAFPNVRNRREDLIPGPAIAFASGLRGDAQTVAPLFDSVSTFDFSGVVPELNLSGVLTARGVAIDLPNQGVTEVGSAVTIYPGLREKLESDPDFLKKLGAFDLDDLGFDFYVAAAATPMTTAEYIDYQRDEAENLRNAILADEIENPNSFIGRAQSALVSIAGDQNAFADLYLQALVENGLLREQDVPPVADGSAENINSFFSVIGGLMGGETGAAIIVDVGLGLATAESNLNAFVELIRGYYGHTPDVTSGGGNVPLFEEYDLQLSNPTSFVTFELRAGPPPLFDGGEVADQIVFNLDDLGQQVGDTTTLVGPTGFGPDNFIPIETPLPYTITTTYDTDAVDSAREIRILVPLDESLDERSFQLADIRLGNLEIPLPQGRPNFVGEFDLTDTEGYVLQVTAGVDANTRVASYLLRAIDGRDGLPPVDPAIGLLQPGEAATVGFWASVNNVAAAGNTDTLVTGDAISMTARGVIDGGAPVDSLTSIATIDAFAPTSIVSVTAVGGNRFEVRWSATDDDGGSGVAKYSLLISSDGGNRYRTLLYRTEDTSFEYSASNGEQPVFLVRAIDHAGNVEPVADGVRAPRLVPDINLGAAPSATFAPPVVIPRAVPSPSTVADRLFQEAAFGIPSQTSPTRPSEFPRVIRPLAAEGLVNVAGESGANIGALAMAVAPNGNVLLSGGSGRDQLFVFDPVVGQSSLRRLPGYSASSPIYDLVFDAAGQLWASTGGQGLLQIDPTNGTVLGQFGAGVALGLAAIPGETAIYVSTTAGISRFDTATRKFRPFSNVRVDSMAVAPDGTLYGTAWPTGGQILRFDFRGRAEQIATVDGNAESIAFGPTGSLLEGALLVGHEADGKISVVDPLAQRQTIIAMGGNGRVEGIQPIGNGRFLATQGEQVDVFFAVAAPRVIETRIAEGTNRAELVFDVGLLRNAANPAGGDNPANYSLRNRETGESVNIGSVQYNPAARTANLLFETLPPAEYELTVDAVVESEQGIPIGGEGFTTTFRVFEDVSISTRLDYSNTRLNRADGTLLFDVVVSNTADFDISGPIQVVFGGLADSTVVFFDESGAPAGMNGYQILGDQTVLAAGARSDTHTITIANPNLLDLNFQPRILATLPPNQLPEFSTDPVLSADVGTAYQYTAAASDPDGTTITYVLADGPAGATVDPSTGQIDWIPTKANPAETPFELRAYDARGAYRRQQWIVDLTGANRAPVVSPIDDQLFTEGDLIEIPVSAFDPDGDDLFYFADHLLPGAVFDAFGQALRWRPGGNDAGVYDNVTLIASDGFVESSVSFQLVVANKNVAPELSPIPARTINEGDAITFTLFGEDEDGDRLRYLSPDLPPGSYLDPNTGIFEWTPGFDQHGVYDLQFFADDGSTMTGQSTQLTVENVNGPVRFPSIDPVEIFEGQAFSLRVAAFDPEYPVAPIDPRSVSEDFFVDFESFLPELTYTVTGLPAGAEFDEARQLLKWTPSFNDSGQYDITFEAADDGDGTGTPSVDTVVVSITVKDANFPPEVVEIAAQSLAVGQTLQIPIVASDFEGTPLALSVNFGEATRLPDFATFTDNGDGTGLLSLAPLPGDRTDLLVTVSATELTGSAPLTSQTQFTLQVTSDNEPPKLSPLFDNVVLVGSEYRLDLLITDDDEDALTVVGTNLPAGAELIDTGVYGRHRFRWIPTAADLGSLDVTFTVTDSGNGNAANALSDSATFKLIVRDNNVRPSLNPIGQQTVSEGDTLTFAVSASDADGDRVSFTAGLVSAGVVGRLPSGARFDQATGTFTWTPNLNQAGTYRIRVTATDGAGSRSEDVLVTVTNKNQAPSFSTLPQLFTREGDQMVFSLTAGDPDGETLVYRFDGIAPTGFEFDPSARTVVWDVGFDAAGDYRFPFTVTDPSGATDNLDVDVRVSNTNRAPVILAPQLRNAEIGALLEVPIVTSDPDGQVVTLSASDLPAGATLDADNVLRWTAASFQAGTYTVRLTADDGDLRTQRPLTLVASLLPAGPTLRIVTTPSFPATPGQPITIEPIADSDVEVSEAILRVDGVALELDELGRGTFVSNTPGRFEIQAEVTDAEGRTTTVTSPLFVRNPGDFAAPEIEVTQLEPPRITEPRELMLSISDDGLAEYRIELVPQGGTVGLPVAQGRHSVMRLITVDPARFANGFYTLRVTATDFGGLTSEFTYEIEINSSNKSVALLEAATDMTIALDGVTVPITRVYDSLTLGAPSSGFGSQWSIPLLDPQLELGTGDDPDDPFPSMTDRGRVYLTLPDGARVGFSFSPIDTTSGTLQTFAPAWQADAGIDWRLESLGARLRKAGDGFFVVGSGLPYSPTLARDSQAAFTLVSPSGERYEYASNAVSNSYRLQRIVAADASTSLRVTESGIIAPTGDRLTIVRDAEGRIGELVGPAGEHFVYRYDDAGRLSAAINVADGSRTFYAYDGVGQLTAIAPSNSDGTSFEYDVDGVVTSSQPIGPHLGGTRDALIGSLAKTLGQEPDTYAFTITAGELRSSPTGGLTIGVDVEGAIGEIIGLTAGTSVIRGSRTIQTYTITEPGTYRLQVRGAAASAYTAELYLVGDLNGDFRVDATDSTAFAAAFGSVSGDANYILAADADRDGDVDAIDRTALNAMFGFVANRAPESAGTTAIESIDFAPVVLSLLDWVADPESDPVFFVSNSDTGTIRQLGGGLIAFSPDVENAIVTVVADDGLLVGAAANAHIDVLRTDPVILDLDAIELLNVGEVEPLRIRSVALGGQTIELDNRQIQWTVDDPGIASVTDQGLVIAESVGSTIVRAAYQNLFTAIAVTVGQSSDRVLAAFPLSYRLDDLNQRRQFQLQELVGESLEDRSAALAGTTYVVGNPSLLAVSPDGLFTPLADGITQVTVINGDYQLNIPVSIDTAAPSIGETTVDPTGASVANASGVRISLGPGGLPAGEVVTIADLNPSDVIPPPSGFEIVGGFDYGAGQLSVPFSVSMPAPAHLNVGEDVYLMEQAEVVGSDGVVRTSWVVVDHMVVDSDRTMRTASLGYGGTGGISGAVASGMNMSGKVIAGYGGQSGLAVGGSGPTRRSAIEITDEGGNRFYGVASFPGGFRVPVPPVAPYELRRLEYDRNGLVRTSQAVQLNLAPGQVADVGLVAIPKPEGTAGSDFTPLIETASLSFETGRARLTLTGKDFLPGNHLPSTVTPWTNEDLSLVFQIGDQDEFDKDGNQLSIGGFDLKLGPGDFQLSVDRISVDVPQKALIGLSTIRIEIATPVLGQTRVFRSNDVRVAGVDETGNLPGKFAFVGLPQVGFVSVIDTTMTQTIVGDQPVDPANPPRLPDPREVARFGLRHQGSNLRPTSIILAPDLTRGYAIASDSGQVAVFDAVAFQQHDANPATEQLDAISLPAGARPYRGEIDPAEHYLFLTDRHRGAVYVVDINEHSNTFHKLVRTITVPVEDARIGFRDLAISIDGQRLYVAAPARDLFQESIGEFGSVLVFDLTPDQEYPLIERIPAGPSPFAIVAASDDPMLAFVSDRVARSEGISIIRREIIPSDPDDPDSDPIESHRVQPIDVRTIGGDTKNSLLIQPFGLNDISGVTYVPANQFAFRNPELGDDAPLENQHSAYLLVTGYNRFVQGDPLRDPNFPILPLLSHPELSFDQSESGLRSRVVVPATAGGNVGLIRLGIEVDDQFENPVVVAATRPTPLAFPSELAFTPRGGGQVLVPYPALDGVWVFSLSQMIFLAEDGFDGPISIYGRPGKLFQPSALSPNFRGSAFESIPIDDLFPSIDVKADFRFFSTVNREFNSQTSKRELVFGVPDVDRFGISRDPAAHPFAPIDLGSSPMGIATQLPVDVIAPRDNPFNQRVNLCETGTVDCSMEAAIAATTTAELHSGAVKDAHVIAGYRTGNQTRELVFHYDSLRADPQPIIHFKFPEVPSDPGRTRVAIARLKVIGVDEFGDTVEYVAKGIPLTPETLKRGLQGDDHLFLVPSEGGDLGAAIQIDLTDAPSGLYRYELEAGIYYKTGDGRFVGESGTFAGDLPVVNFSPEAPGPTETAPSGNHFGAGWGIEGVYRIYDRGNGLVLLANGDGNESIRRYTSDANADLQPEVGDISRLRKESDGTFIMADTVGTLRKFDADGRMTSVIDLFGNETVYEYQEDRLVKITDPFGGFFELSYSGGQLTKILDSTGRETVFTQNEGLLSAIADADGASRKFGYDADQRGLLKTVIQKRGNPYPNGAPETSPNRFLDVIEYTPAGRAKSGRRVDGVEFFVTPAQMTGWYEPKFTTDIDAITKPLVPLEAVIAKHTDARGEEYKTKIDVFGLYLEANDDLGDRPDLTRNGNNRVTEELFESLSGVEQKREYEYDDFGNVIRIKDANGDITKFTYRQAVHPIDSRFRVSVRETFTDPFGRVTQYENSSDGRVKKTIRTTAEYGQVTTQEVLDSRGLPSKLIDELGRETKFKVNSQTGNTIETEFPSDGVTAAATEMYGHDRFGNVNLVTDAMGFQYKTEYDAFNRKVKVTGPTNLVERFKYDAAGNLREITDNDGGVIKSTYDSMNRQLTITDAVGVTTTMKRDEYGRVRQVTDGRGVVTQRFTYDTRRPASGLITLVQFADKTTNSFSYTDDGDIRSETDARNNTTIRSYNSRGQLTSARDAAGRKATYTYDQFGRQKTAQEFSGPMVALEYDGLDRQIKTTTGTGSEALTSRLVRNAAGEILQVFEPSPSGEVEVKQEYDARGRLIRRTIAPGTPFEAKFEFEYDLNGRRTLERGPLGDETKWEYFDDGKLKSVTYRADLPLEQQSTESYTYDNAGRPKRITDPIGRYQEYTYNKAGHITEFKFFDSDGALLREIFFRDFDGAGNPQTRIEDGVSIRLQYDAMQRIDKETSSVGDESVAVSRVFNGNGDPTTETNVEGLVTNSSYDNADRIQEMTVGVGTTAPLRSTYTYDKLGGIDQIRYFGGTDTRLLDHDYDSVGRTTQVTLSGTRSSQSRTTKYEYDSSGRLSAEIDAEGRRTEFSRDLLGRIIKATHAKGTSEEYSTSYEFDKVGRVTAIEVANQVNGETVVERTEIEFDERGFPKKRTDGAGSATERVTHYRYDKVGRLVEQIDEISYLGEQVEKVSQYTYDGLDRVTKSVLAVGADESVTEIRTYDGLYPDTVVQQGVGGSTTDYDFDGFGRLIQKIDNLGTASAVKVQYEYTDFGKLQKETASASGVPNRVTTYTYAGRNWLSGNTTLGASTSVEYDVYGNPIRMVDDTGRVTTAAYDSFDQLVEYTVGAHAADATRYAQEYDRVGNLTEVRSAARVVNYEYNALNQRIEERTVGGELTAKRTFTYDSVGRLLSLTDAEQNTSRNKFDAIGNLVSMTDALNRETTIDYDSAGRMRRVTAPDGYQNEYEYDLFDRQTLFKDLVDGVQRTIRQNYNTAGQLTDLIDPLGRTQTYGYDGSGFQSTVTDAGITGSSLFDAFGVLKSSTEGNNAFGPPVAFATRSDGRIEQIQSSTGGVKSIAYETNGLPQSVTDVRGTTRFSYTPHGQVKSISLPAGGDVQFDYNQEGQMKELIDAMGNTTLFEHDGLGRPAKITNASGTIRTFGYDLEGNLKVTAIEGGPSIDRVLDAVYQIDSETWRSADGTVENSVAYDYNSVNLPDNISDVYSGIAFSYDNARRIDVVDLTSPGIPDVSVDVDYNLANQLESQVVSIGGQTVAAITFGYDAAGRRKSITQTSAGQTIQIDLDYDPSSGFLTRLDRGLGDQVAVSAVYDYNPTTALLDSLRYQNGSGSELVSFVYTRDADGRVRTETVEGQSRTFTYDAAGQLTGVDYQNSSIADEHYDYDSAGNRVSTHLSSVYVIGTDNRLTNDGTYQYTFDKAGNVETRLNLNTNVLRTYRWDARNRLIEVHDSASSQSSAKKTTYRYDIQNRRIATSHDPDTSDSAPAVWRYFVYGNGDDVLAELVDPDGPNGPAVATIDRFVIAGPLTDQVLGTIAPDGTVTWNLSDQLQSVRASVDAAGQMVNRTDFDAFGNLIPTANTSAVSALSDSRYGFTGREHDVETGLIYYRNRYYDPSIGRFLSEDPTGYAGLDENLYRYVSNDPINTVDPTGLVGEMATYAEDYAIFQQQFGVSLSASEALIDGFNRSQRSFIANGLIDLGKFAYHSNPITEFTVDAGVGFVTRGFETIRDLAGGAIDAAGYLLNQLDKIGVPTPLASLPFVVQDGEYIPQGAIGKAIYQLNQMNRQYISEDNYVAYYIGAPLKTSGQVIGGIVQGTLQIPVDLVVGAVTGEGEKFGGAVFDLVTTISPAKFKAFNQRYGRLVTELGKDIVSRGLKESFDLRFRTIYDSALSNDVVQYAKYLSLQKALGKFFFNKDFDERVRGLASKLAQEVSAKYLKEGHQLSNGTVRRLGTVLKFQEVIGELLNPLREIEGYENVGNFFRVMDPDNAWAINPAKESKIRFIADQLATKELVGRRSSQLSAAGRTLVAEQKFNAFNASMARQNLKRLMKTASPEDRAALRQADELLRKHQYNLPAVHRNIADRVRNLKNDPIAIKEFVETPFLSESHASFLKHVTEVLTRDGLRSGGKVLLEADELLGLTARGTGGGSLVELNIRGDRVAAVHSADLLVLTSQFFSFRSAFRVQADVFKTPMGDLSDLDLNISVRGGEKLLKQLSAKGDVNFGSVSNPRIKELKYAPLVQGIVDSIDNIQDLSLRNEIRRFATDKKFFVSGKGDTPPIELYVADNPEFGRITNANAIGDPLLKGGTTFYLDGDVVRSVQNASILFNKVHDPSARFRNLVAFRRGALTAAESNLGQVSFLHADAQTASGLILPFDVGVTLAPQWVSTHLSHLWDGSGNPLLGLLNAAAEDWSGYLDLPDLEVELVVEPLLMGQLAAAYIELDAAGQPTGSATIVVDDDASGRGWYLDMNPQTDEEFEGGEAPAGYDLLTVLRHELGHLFGFTSANPVFVAMTEVTPDGMVLRVGEHSHLLDASGNELAHSNAHDSLMSARLPVETRRGITPLDQGIFKSLGAVSSTPWFAGETSQWTGFQLAPAFGFDLLRALHEGESPTTRGLRNDDFAIIDTSDPGFAWKQIGDVSVADGVATISEDVGMISDLSQTFVVPSGISTLTFTLGGISMDVGTQNGGVAAHPPEVFEIAVIDSIAGTSMLPDIEGIDGGDAVVNIQADGTVYFADGVRIGGIRNSGDKVDFSKPFDVIINLPAEAARETATLLFDLVGFGNDESQVQVSNIVLDATNGWQNPIDPFDVSDNGEVTATDAIQIINELARASVYNPITKKLVEITDKVGPAPYYDVNGDGFLTALDALRVINQLARQGASPSPEMIDSAFDSLWDDDE